MGTQNGTEAVEKEDSTSQEGEQNATETTDKETDATGSEQEDGASEDGQNADEGSGGTDNGEDQGEDEQAGTPGVEERLAVLEAENKELKEKLTAPKEEKPQNQGGDTGLVQLTDADYQHWESETGLPKQAIDFIRNLVYFSQKKALSHTDSKFAGYEQTNVLASMAQSEEYADIKKYQPGIEEYLKNHPEKPRNDKGHLAEAYYYAKGKAAGKMVRSAQQAAGATKKMVDRSKMSSPNGSKSVVKTKTGGGSKLSPVEKSAYDSFGRFSYKSEEEYAASLPRNKK